jgi:gluconate 5-dehydrogenase
MASMGSIMGLPQASAYSAAKSALLGLTRSLAAEWSPKGIRVNAIAPGWIETPMLKQAMAADPQRQAKVLGRTPLNCFGAPEDIAYASVYLSSPAARFVTGSCLVVDGGASIGL